MALIFLLSAMPGSENGSHLPIWYTLIRKGAHVFEFAVLTLLACRFFESIVPGVPSRKTIFFAVLMAFIYACTDEFHQAYVFGRYSRVTDVLIDSFGIFLMAGYVVFLKKQR
jgi:VanZ family protein